MTRTWQISTSTATLLALQKELHQFFRKRIARSVDVDDLVNATWLSAGRNFKGLCSLRHYLFFVAKWVLIDDHRRSRRFEPDGTELDELPAELRRLESRIMLAQWQERVDHAAAQVPDPFDEVVALWLSGHDTMSISRKLGINYNTVRSRLRRGKVHFYAALSAEE